MLLTQRILIVGAVAFALAAGLTVADSTPAHAATKNAGIAGLTPDGGYLGNYLAPDGSRVYCIDSPLPWPSGATSGPTVVDEVITTWGEPLPRESLQRLNYVLLGYGQTDDPTQAAAVAAFVNAYTSGWARDLGAGYDAGVWYLNGDAGVIATYDAIWADAEANALPAYAAALRIEMTDESNGMLVVDVSHPDATGTVTLDGAVRADDGATEFSVGAADEVALRGVPSDESREYAIGASASFSAPTTAAPSLTLYVTDGQQRTVRGTASGTLQFASSTSTPGIPLDFAPVLSTRVTSELVDVGEPFVDIVTAALADGSRPWRVRSDGTAVPVVAEGVLYGPFAEPPVTGTSVPGDAVVAGRETLLLAGVGEYRSSGAFTAAEPGYYTWVWEIDAAAQDAAVQASLPVGYAFVSPFGLAEETHRVPVPQQRLAATGSAPQGVGAAGAALVATGVLTLIGVRRQAKQRGE
jgi:hypothetical protein